MFRLELIFATARNSWKSDAQIRNESETLYIEVANGSKTINAYIAHILKYITPSELGFT
jgi:hypothetical protein